MRDSLFFLFAALIANCICGHLVFCTESHDLLKEDLFLPSQVQLNDEDYDIVQIWHRDFKSGDKNMKQLRVKRGNVKIHLTMQETSVIREKAPVWLVYSDTNVTQADENIISDAVKFYEDPDLVVTFATDYDKYGHPYFLGSVSQGTVRPLSARTVRSLKTEKPHLFEGSVEPGSVDETGEFTATDYHVIYRAKKPENGTLVLPLMGHPEIFSEVITKDNPPAHERLKRTTADVIYPEILAIVDYNQTFTTIYEYRFLNLLMYTIGFWNTVNHRYDSLTNPKIQLRLTGIMVIMNRKDFKFIQDATDKGNLNADKIISEMPTWVATKVQKHYDLVVVQTNNDLCGKPKGATKCKRGGLLGLAYVAAPCSWGSRSFMSGVFYDDFHHTGEATAAHEIGHVLGAQHDDKNSPTECIDTNGYIMSWNAQYNEKNFEWSRCSKDQISAHLRRRLSSCLDNSIPNGSYQGELVKEPILPGRIDPEYQCLLKGYTGACEADNICENLSCKWYWCKNAGPALEGTPCPEGKCRNGKCVAG